VWFPALIAGWLASAVLIAALVLWSMFYVWRRRQYESLINRLERELAGSGRRAVGGPAPHAARPEQRSVQAAGVRSYAEHVEALGR